VTPIAKANTDMSDPGKRYYLPRQHESEYVSQQEGANIDQVLKGTCILKEASTHNRIGPRLQQIASNSIQ
jgi:hypothetical protein